VLPYLRRSSPPLGPLTPSLEQLADELRRDVSLLAIDVGPRGTHSPLAYRLAEDHLGAALAGAGFEVRRHGWEANGVRCVNLETVLPGSVHPERIVVLGAHYDSVVGCPAANDNASGVAGVLAIARRLQGRPRACTVRFVLFGNEEPPFFNLGEMGSQLYARACRDAGDDIRGMACLETIGYYSGQRGSQRWPGNLLSLGLPDVGDFICMVGPVSARSFIERCAEAFERRAAFPLLAAAVPETLAEQVSWSDHRGFNEVDYPAFMVTDTAPLRYPHYHLPSDTPEKLDYGSMARVVAAMQSVVEDVADSM